MRGNARSPVATVLVVLAATAASVVLMLSVAVASADARTYVGRFAGGGAIALKVSDGRLRHVAASLPAGCDNNHGGRWTRTLEVDVSGALALRSGRFSVQGEAPNGVRGDLRGRLRNGTIAGRLRLTDLYIDHFGVDESYLCDTGTRPFRAN
jgi:hypothetical protein